MWGEERRKYCWGEVWFTAEGAEGEWIPAFAGMTGWGVGMTGGV